MKGDTVYSNNEEDFYFDDVWEALEEQLADDGERPKTSEGKDLYTVYEGELTDQEMIEPEGSFAVINITPRKFALKYPHTYGLSEWTELHAR